MKQVVQ